VTEVGPLLLAVVSAETFEHFDDDPHSEAGRLLYDAPTHW
jgi:hypothetical protein